MDRFWSKVARRDSGCWEWVASRAHNGYGKFRHDGRFWAAHRLAFELSVGPIPDGLLVCHRCDNPPCCNPEHLFLGTKSDNAKDMIGKARHWIVTDPGRRKTGGEAHLARLTEPQIARILELRAAGLSQRVIAARVGTSQGHVSRILAGKCWPHFAEAG